MVAKREAEIGSSSFSGFRSISFEVSSYLCRTLNKLVFQSAVLGTTTFISLLSTFIIEGFAMYVREGKTLFLEAVSLRFFIIGYL